MPDIADEEALPRLLAGLGDEASYKLIRRLLQAPQTTSDLIDPSTPGLNQSGVSSRLIALQRMGLVDMAGRGGKHAIRHEAELYAILRATLGLAERIAEERSAAIKRARRTLSKEQLAAAPPAKGESRRI